MSEGVDLWYVKLPSGDVHRVTLDQLDGAFQAGHIDGRTMVLPSDAGEGTSWTSLGQLLGLDEEPSAPVEDEPQYIPQRAAPPQAAQYVPQIAQPQYVPQAAQYVPQIAQPRHVPQAAQYVPQIAQPQYVPQAAQYVPQIAQPQYVPQAAAQHAPRAVVQPRAYASVAPGPAPSATPPPAAYGLPAANSLRPMTFDLGSDVDELPFQRKSRKGWVAGMFGVAVAAGVAGFFSTHARSSGDDISTVAAAAAMAAPQSYAAPPPAPDPVPAPVVAPSPAAAPATQAAPAEASPLNPQFTTRLNETTREKLLAADKAHGAKAQSRHAWRGSRSSSKSGVFTHNGNKYDPLNSDL